jgi:hypothetical protein
MPHNNENSEITEITLDAITEELDDHGDRIDDLVKVADQLVRRVRYLESAFLQYAWWRVIPVCVNAQCGKQSDHPHYMNMPQIDYATDQIYLPE